MLNMFYIHAGPSMMWTGSMRVNYLADSSRAATGGQTGKTAVLPAKNRVACVKEHLNARFFYMHYACYRQPA